jgi:hypothetical protein
MKLEISFRDNCPSDIPEVIQKFTNGIIWNVIPGIPCVEIEDGNLETLVNLSHYLQNYYHVNFGICLLPDQDFLIVELFTLNVNDKAYN